MGKTKVMLAFLVFGTIFVLGIYTLVGLFLGPTDDSSTKQTVNCFIVENCEPVFNSPEDGGIRYVAVTGFVTRDRKFTQSIYLGLRARYVAVKNQPVYLFDSTGVTHTSVTDNKGSFAFHNVPQGNSSILICHDGYYGVGSGINTSIVVMNKGCPKQ